MPTLSNGLNITKKPPAPVKSGLNRRKPIFDDDSGPDDAPEDPEDNVEAISSIGGLRASPSSARGAAKSKSQPHSNIPSKPSKPPRISQYGDLSTNHTTSKHAQSAQSLDPSIYDYDAVYDSLHSRPKSHNNAPGDSSAAAAADEAKKPKYMQSLLVAAEVRKRDQLRAKEKMLAKERELEGDEFADKEKFVTAAYKRQQEELRKAEAEEALREHEAEERQRKQGGGLKGMYKNMLERDEEKHAEAIKLVEEAKKSGTYGKGGEGIALEESKEQTEAELAKEKGAVVNEEGQVVDKRQLLNAGLNAGSAPKAKVNTLSERDSRGGRKERRTQGDTRGRQSQAFEDQLLGKRDADSGGEEDNSAGGRAAKSRKVEDEILASLGL
ncbi:MAG: hypothetical protein Q9219_004157 [cf. Caloplaca sp. 3 TL-2023]